MNGQKCCTCKEFKDFSLFSKNRSEKSGYARQCKSCAKKKYQEKRESILANKKEYYILHRDDILEQKAEYRKQDYVKERKAIYNKQYRIDNADDLAEYHKQYREDNKDRISEQNSKYREENKEELSYLKKEYGNSPALYNTYYERLTNIESPKEGEDGILLVKCAHSDCRLYFSPTNYEVQRRIQSLNGNQTGESRLYCSERCKETCSIFGQKKYPKDFKKSYSSNEFPDFVRDEILKRDKYKCQICGETHDLHAHHIYPGAIYHNLSKDVKNGITLCKECHIKVHSLPGCGFNEIAACSQRIKKELEEQGINLNEIPDWAVDKYMNKETLKGATP